MPDPTKAVDHFKKMAIMRDRVLYKLVIDATALSSSWAAQRKAVVWRRFARACGWKPWLALLTRTCAAAQRGRVD